MLNLYSNSRDQNNIRTLIFFLKKYKHEIEIMKHYFEKCKQKNHNRVELDLMACPSGIYSCY